MDATDIISDDEFEAILAELEGEEQNEVEQKMETPAERVTSELGAELEADVQPVAAEPPKQRRARKPKEVVEQAVEVVEETVTNMVDDLVADDLADAFNKPATSPAASRQPDPAVSEQPAASRHPEPAASTPVTDDVSAFIDPNQLKRDIQYSEADISSAFADQASKFVDYAVIAGRAGFQMDKLKNTLSFVEAKVDKELRDAAAEEGRKVTEAALEKQILLDVRYQKALRRYTEAKMIAGLAKDALEAFRQRRDMLIQVGADLREEMKGELRMRVREEGRQDLTDRARALASAQRN